MFRSISETFQSFRVHRLLARVYAALPVIGNCVVLAFLTLGLLHLSLLRTSAPLDGDQTEAVERALGVLQDRGFSKEVSLLRNIATFRGTDNWLNGLVESENAFAATNFPFGIITLYPDFFTRATDDIERAMILLHESRHLIGGSEKDAFGYVWRNRQKLGWTTLSHGMTPAFVTIDIMTREFVPELFTCEANLWSDCTEQLRAKR